MDHEIERDTDELGATPIRAAIDRTREELAEHLAELKESFFPSVRAESPEENGSMPTKKATSPKAAGAKSKGKAAEAAAKSTKTATGKGKATAAATKRPASRKTAGAVAKTGEVLDTMLAGAIVGAVTGAARELNEGSDGKQGLASSKRGKVTTADVVGEMAPGAAVGAVVGAADSVLPKEKGKAKAARKR